MYRSHPTDPANQRGMALITVLFVVLIMMMLGATMMILSRSQRAVAVNEQDYLKAISHAEAGLAWAEGALDTNTDMTDMLRGIDDTSTAVGDDNLLGLRDLSLTSSGQLTLSNENTKSAIVTRDFFGVSRTYELLRIDTSQAYRAPQAGPDTRANLYVRVDDNYDDDPDDPSADDPLTDTDGRVKVTVVAEYPVFVDGAGAELATNSTHRGRARRGLEASFSVEGSKLPAIASNGPISIPGRLKLCGDCGSMHTNDDLSIGGTPSTCGDGTASGRFSGFAGGIGGDSGGGFPRRKIPVINPYHEVFLPTIATFDTSGDTSLPAGLRCPQASVTDPGSSKFFALVADNDKGRIFKAYWDFTNNRWNWVEIADLAGPDVRIDDCGRRNVDLNFEAGASAAVDDGISTEFYGFSGDRLTLGACASCIASGADESLCASGENDFGTQTVLGGPEKLPGTFSPDSLLDYDPTLRLNDAQWDFSGNTVWSPLFGAVIWVFGNVSISGNPANDSWVDFRCSGGAGCSNVVVPGGTWRASIIAVGDIQISGDVNIGPANPAAGYNFSAIAGRDLLISGNPATNTAACSFGCNFNVYAPAKLLSLAGIYAAHEQIAITGNPNIFGILVAEDAMDCSTLVDGSGGGLSTLGGDPRIYYDCNHPPNPWDEPVEANMLSWKELN